MSEFTSVLEMKCVKSGGNSLGVGAGVGTRPTTHCGRGLGSGGGSPSIINHGVAKKPARSIGVLNTQIVQQIDVVQQQQKLAW